jgi:peptidoglycan/LPS O-acetylase OafA/YrhL
LRGIAALSVVLFHFTMGRPEAKLGFNICCMGVDMFFVISGFVIFMTVEKSKNWKNFVWNRFARLYPAYWICVTFTAACIIFKTHFYIEGNSTIANNLPVKYLVNMTMFQYYLHVPDLDGPYWTLIIELLFYSMMVLLMLIKKINHLESIGFILLLFSASYSLNVVASNYYFHGILQLFPLISYFPLFYAGIILYKMKFKEVSIWRLTVFGLTIIVQFLTYKNCYRNAYYVDFTQYSIAIGVIYFLFLLFLFGKLGFIINPVTKWLGEISYSLYLIHQYVSTSILIPGAMMFLHFNFWEASALALPTVLLLATFVNRFIEKPAMNYLRKKYN